MHDSSVALWHTDDLSHADYARARHRSFAFQPHLHDTHCLALITGGAMRLSLGRHSDIVGKGDVIVIEAGAVHAGARAAPEGWAMRTLHVAPPDFAAHLAASGLPAQRESPPRSGVHRDPELAALFFGIHACAQLGDDRLKRDEHLLRLARRLARCSPPAIAGFAAAAPGARVAERIRDYIEARLAEPIRLDDLARVAALPPYAVVRAFKRRFGLPPHRYHLQRRIDLARRLIGERVPLAGVSQLCGFADQAHFTRAWTRHFGFSPGRYARSLA